MEPVEDRQRHRHVRDDRPSPIPEELEVCRSEFRPVLFQRIDRPHRHVGDDQERDQFPAWFALRLLRVAAAPPPAVQHEHRLDARLDEGEDFGEETSWGVSGGGEVASDDREHAVDEHSGLGHHQERVVQAYARLTIT